MRYGVKTELLKRMECAGGRDLLLNGWSRAASQGGGL